MGRGIKAIERKIGKADTHSAVAPVRITYTERCEWRAWFEAIDADMDARFGEWYRIYLR